MGISISTRIFSTNSEPFEFSERARPMGLSQLKKATHGFDESLVIGKGYCGKVYRAQVSDGGGRVVDVAVKRLSSSSMSGVRNTDWPWPEVERISGMRHNNIVPLIGYNNRDTKLTKSGRTVDEKRAILVYEYVPNGTLKDHLHVRRTPLSWLQRLNICLGAARGLEYLHGTGPGCFMHGDLRSSNILLTETLEAKVADFGLSKFNRKDEASGYFLFQAGTFGYWDRYSLSWGALTWKSDIFSFGVVMLEVLCRRLAIDRSYRLPHERSLVQWVEHSLQVQGKTMEDLVDSEIKNEISPEYLKDFHGLVERCMLPDPTERPEMDEVARTLEALRDQANHLSGSSSDSDSGVQ